MNIFVYSDESGVFDKVHNKYFVFGGVIFFSKEERDIAARKYLRAERTIRDDSYDKDIELKACWIANREKGKLFRSLNSVSKFAIIVHEERVLDSVCSTKKNKQRFLDYVYKVGLKRYFQNLIYQGRLNPNEVEGLYIFADEHTTATSGIYELQEGIEQEFKHGTHNWEWSCFYPPVFTNIQHVKVEFCNSEDKTLIRAADIVANRAYYIVRSSNGGTLDLRKRMFVAEFP